MTSRDLVEDRILALTAMADLDELVPRLEAYTRTYLQNVARHPEPRQRIVDAYVLQAIDETLRRGADYAAWRPWETLFQLLCIVVAHLVDQYERTFAAIVRQTEWDDMIQRLIAHTVNRYGGRTSRHGRTAEDYVLGAIAAMLGRQRYFPYDRVTLFIFLCGTIRSLHAHEAERIAAEGTHLTIVNEPFGQLAPSEWNAESLVAPNPGDDDAALLQARDFLLRIENPALRRYAELRAFGAHGTAAEYGRALDVPEQMIRNWDRQLRRARARWDPGS